MVIAVFGGNGRVGQKVVTQLLENGHSVRLLIHSHSSLAKHPKMTLVKGDVHSAKDVAGVILGSDAVVSCLSSWGTKTKDIQVAAMQNIIPAMKKNKISRVVSVTGSGVFDMGDTPNILDKLGRKAGLTFAGKVFKDGENHIKLLRDSQLDWTVIRSPIMTKQAGNEYVLSESFPSPLATVSRDNVAKAMVDLVTSKSHSEQSPFIGNKK